jgi:hypothetical protein
MVMDNRIDVALEAHRIIAPLLSPQLGGCGEKGLAGAYPDDGKNFRTDVTADDAKISGRK